MAIVGLGSDIVQIDRLNETLQPRLAKRILTESEYTQWLESSRPGAFLAKRFAAKEAAAKALGTGIAKGVSFQDFIVENDALGKPHLNVQGRAEQLSVALGVSRWFLSISDERDYAMAVVLCES
ncbi:holo-ACP synthase [Celerinatantimonas diazotrophica]|uniref:Holo-[acyl-carrier-protein] synthase n=1 Tax=Celerinatantimonas diazotrophica TaxID=412034 RepID=A0A4R1J977_9GAMM|nr:holo-ACP synthase [Celerinatantimonas diazotrophica]TCK47152.1 holo-[acyl-carrier protein] synthase [Celerinatantimonas diazotrophica]CAG9295924.1 Holo-[acyl-carrier-protein] synthase [Celerinatantimonas diazotrophica]